VRSARSPWIAVFGLAMLAVAGATAGTTAPDLAPSGQKVVAVLEVRGAIGPATSRYIERALESAQTRGDPAVILQMDTPGGLDSSMRDIIRAILASRVPVVSYVAPPGARAASAGTYILYASHVAAMAPATNLGAATPVSIGGESPPTPAPAPTPAPDKGGKSPTDTAASADTAQTPMERKVVNDAVAYIRGLAELRGRNADWAEQAVRGAASLSATAALQNHVIDLIARDVPDLLTQLDGRHVKVGEQTLTLATRNVATLQVEPDWRTRLLSVITNPTVAYGLMLIGIYGLLLEGYNPGAVLPGVVGAISLLLALFAFQILSVNYAGLALVGLGIALIIAEFFLPTFGSLGLGGLVAFVAGSIILLDTDVPGLNIAMPLIAGIAVGGGLILLGLVYVASRSLRRPVVTGAQAMVGAAAEAFEDFSERGRVRFGGEIWNANTSAPVHAGQPVRIVRVDGLTLWVEPAAGARRS
jgi:membrane-bound serine protease (ClpP class)